MPPPAITLFDAAAAAASAYPDKTLIVGGDIRWTYSEVLAKVERLAASMAARGIGRGDVISMQLPNRAEFILVHLAATRLGAITNSLLPIYRAKELGYILGFAKSRMLFIPGVYRGFDYRELHRGLLPELPDLEHVCVVGDNCPDDMIPFDALLGEDWPAVPVRPSEGSDITALIFTSGTEATPKGVMHSHDTLMFDNRAVADLLGLSSDEIFWAPSPLGHSTGLIWAIRIGVLLGATIILQDPWDPAAAVDLIERERCTITTAATPFATMLAAVPGIEERDLSSLRIFLCGGATIPSTLAKTVADKIGCTLIPLWGMSECPISSIARLDDPPEIRFGTAGRAVPGTEMGIFDATRTRQVGPGEEGEIATRGLHTCLGYFNDPERTGQLFNADGWLFSNDLGTMDAHGNVRVVGRIKDIINRGGLKISAAEVEDHLLRHPLVQAVAVVAVPDEALGEKACACIVPEAGQPVSLHHLTDHLRAANMAAYKLPEYVAIVTALPMTPTGKIQKFKLREDIAAGRLAISSH
jgi:non-ribosomal peptide synthetase component E (peptide arylation enzyme)